MGFVFVFFVAFRGSRWRESTPNASKHNHTSTPVQLCCWANPRSLIFAGFCVFCRLHKKSKMAAIHCGIVFNHFIHFFHFPWETLCSESLDMLCNWSVVFSSFCQRWNRSFTNWQHFVQTDGMVETDTTSSYWYNCLTVGVKTLCQQIDCFWRVINTSMIKSRWFVQFFFILSSKLYENLSQSEGNRQWVRREKYL